MGMVAILLLSLIIAFVSSKGIPTKTCDVTSLSELVGMQTQVDFARIACEGGQFNGYECSRYWMINNDLIRKKLSFAWCKANKRQTFRNWAGTHTVEGVFQKEFVLSLQKELEAHNQLHRLLVAEHNGTLSLVLQEAAETLQILVEEVNREAERIRENTYVEESSIRAFDSLQESQTRDVVSSNGEEERELVEEEERTSREKVEEEEKTSRETSSTLAAELRALDKETEEFTREYQSERQAETRDLIENEHERVREESDAESSDTNSLFLLRSNVARDRAASERYTGRKETEEKATEEEIIIRNLVSTTNTANVVIDATEESKTRVEISITSEEDSLETMRNVSRQEEATVTKFTESTASLKNEYTNKSNSTQNEWLSAASSFFSLLSMLEEGVGFPFNTLSLHLDLIQSHARGFPVVNPYTDNLENFMRLRGVVNETVTYNREKYGSSQNMQTAISKFNSGEQELRKAKPDYRVAVLYYSTSYVNAITPNYGKD